VCRRVCRCDLRIAACVCRPSCVARVWLGLLRRLDGFMDLSVMSHDPVGPRRRRGRLQVTRGGGWGARDSAAVRSADSGASTHAWQHLLLQAHDRCNLPFAKGAVHQHSMSCSERPVAAAAGGSGMAGAFILGVECGPG
jgi:hypothetical protein